MTTKSDVLRLKAEVDAKEEEIKKLLDAHGLSTHDPVVVMALLVTVQTSLAFGALQMEEAEVQAKRLLLAVSEKNFDRKES